MLKIISDMKPHLSTLDIDGISILTDNIKYYRSEDDKWKIKVHFRESDIYKNSDGTITHGNYKSLYKISISVDSGSFSIGAVKDYIILSSDIILGIYPESTISVKIDGVKKHIDEFKIIDDHISVEDIKIIIRII